MNRPEFARPLLDLTALAICAAALSAACGSVPGVRPSDGGLESEVPDTSGDGPGDLGAADSVGGDTVSGDARGGGDAGGERPDASDGAAAVDAPRDSACQPEQCNGRDDDCDGVIDDGCPLDQRLLTTRTVATTSPTYGSLTSVGNTGFADSCPDGQVIVGLTGNAGSALDAVGVNCGTLTVREDRSTTPYTYSVGVGPGMQYAPLGGTGGGQNALDNALLCGVDEVVTAIQVSRDPSTTCASNGCAASATSAAGCPTLYGLNVSCAKLAIRGTPGAFTLAYAATPTISAHAGGTGRSGATATVDTFSCTPAGVVRSATGAYGPWPVSCSITVVNGLQLTCTNPVLPIR